jgi:hypothetical protein
MLIRGVITCPCGVSVATTRPERTRYCSNACKYRYRPFPKPKQYRIVNDNPGWYGRHRPHLSGSDHYAWKGEEVGYGQLHDWVQKVKGPYPESCERCGAEGYVEWANVSHEYHRDPEDWMALCKRCHRRHDSGHARGAAVAKYGKSAVNQRAS